MSESIFGRNLPTSDATGQKVVAYNDAIRNTERIAAGYVQVLISGNQTLTDDQAQHAVIEVTGTLSADATLTLKTPAGTPAGFAPNVFRVFNNTSGSHSLTVKTSVSGGATRTVANGKLAALWHDGTNVYRAAAELTP